RSGRGRGRRASVHRASSRRPSPDDGSSAHGATSAAPDASPVSARDPLTGNAPYTGLVHPDSPALPTRHVTTTRIVAVRGASLEFRADRVVGEEPLEIRAAGPGQDPVAVAVTLRTPGFEDELAIGFLRTEGLIEGSEVIRVTTGDPALMNQPDD